MYLKILLVEDDSSLVISLKDLLAQKTYIVEVCNNGEEGLYWLTNHEFAAAILDWQLPKMSGIELLRSFRASGGKTPILMLTGRDQLADKLEGFDTGADDYLCKPFEPRELLARLRALIKRGPNLFPDKLVLGDLEVDTSSRSVARNGVPVVLGSKEYAILELLVRNPGKVFSVDAIIERLWQADSDLTAVSVRSHIARLKSKLDQAHQELPVPLKNVYGMGYKLDLF